MHHETHGHTWRSSREQKGARGCNMLKGNEAFVHSGSDPAVFLQRAGDTCFLEGNLIGSLCAMIQIMEPNSLVSPLLTMWILSPLFFFTLSKSGLPPNERARACQKGAGAPVLLHYRLEDMIKNVLGWSTCLLPSWSCSWLLWGLSRPGADETPTSD